MNPTSAIADGHHALNQYLVRVEEAGWKAALKEARPAAYGDFIAGVLAIIATVALSKRDTWAIVGLGIQHLGSGRPLVRVLPRSPRPA